eukprot:TRINITY_DN105605_c0_g1_i1.p1 TRINITY_DN105605_c0_g1~~TRINITY_DN105605_c0_g1_i1.p1  ORF type:complete len:668 (+),score=126.67 TRINITY_DN105605_c0_g1_i1:232-2004(+)
MNGPVRLATGKGDACKYAIKSFKKNALSSLKRAELKNESEIYLTLDHPQVAKLEMIYETQEELHLVMEYMAGGELYRRLSSKKCYSEADAACCIRQVLLAVAYLHAQGVVHRDLKLENFLYESEDSDHLKLIDFGFAKFWNQDAKMSQACGSLHYVAPEVLEKAYTNKADLWSCGVIAYMLLTGTPPFFGSDNEVLAKIRAGTPHWSQRFLILSKQPKSLVRGLLVADPEQRLSAKAALEHPFVQAGSPKQQETILDADILKSLRRFARASAFRRALLSIMAWSLSNEDRALLREEFLSMDGESRGTITHRELKRVLEERFHVCSEEADMLFSSLDTDHDEEIEYNEFLAAALLARVRVHEDLLRKTFSRFDKNDTGTITAEDLRSVLGDHFDGAEMEELIHEADTSGDGKVNYDAFLEYFYKSDPADVRPLALNLPPVGTIVQEATAEPLPSMCVHSDLSHIRPPPRASNLPLDLPFSSELSTQSAPAELQTYKQKKQAWREKLGAIIDKLVGHGPRTNDVSMHLPRKSLRKITRPLSRRTSWNQTAPFPKVSTPHLAESKAVGLPTLLSSVARANNVVPASKETLVHL